MTPRVHLVRFRRAKHIDVRAGLLGFARINYGGIAIDSVAVRRTRDGRYALSFPARKSRDGAEHSLVSPIDASTYGEIEACVFAELHEQGILP